MRWALALGSVVLGLLFLIAAKLVAYEETWLRGDEASFWSGLFVNVGTTLLLAAVLIWFERVIVRKVREDRQVAVTEAATAAAERTAEAIRPRLDDLDRRIWERTTAAEGERTASAARIGEEGSYQSVRDGLRGASDINAIGRPGGSALGGAVTVPAGFEDVGVDGPTIEVTYMPVSRNHEEEITLRYVHDRGKTEVTWDPAQTPDEVFIQLQGAMVRDGFGRQRRQMSAERFFGDLSSVLIEAVQARNGNDGLWLSTEPVLEKVTDQMFITEKGIETPEGLVVAPWAYGKAVKTVEGTIFLDERLELLAPSGVDPGALEVAIQRGRRHFQKPIPDTPF